MPGLFGVIAVLMIVGGIIIVGYRGHVGTIALLEKTRIAGGIIAIYYPDYFLHFLKLHEVQL